MTVFSRPTRPHEMEPAMPAISPRNPVPDPKQGADARRMAAHFERAVDTLARLPRDPERAGRDAAPRRR